MGSSIYFISALLSLFLYFKAPNEASDSFCMNCALIFFVQSFFILKDDIKRDSLITFNSLFLFSFFLCTYAYPIIIMGSPLEVREGVELFIDYSVSSKCTALCTFAISVYFLAYKRNIANPFMLKMEITASQTGFYKKVYLILFILLLLITVQQFSASDEGGINGGYIYTMYLSVLPVVLIANCIKHVPKSIVEFEKCNRIELSSLLFLIAFYFIIGDRGLVIIGGLTLLTVIHFYVKRFKPIAFIGLIILGAVLMYAIRETRKTDDSFRNSGLSAFVDNGSEAVGGAASAITLFADLTGIHHELYIGYEYEERYGYLCPEQIVIVPFYPIPMVPNLMSQSLFNKTMNEIKPNTILNDYMSVVGYGHFGIHCVIDFFMRWGVLGVLLFFYLWGYIVARIVSAKELSSLGMVLFVLLVASAIRIPRAPILDMLRSLAYVLAIVWGATKFSRNKY